MTALGCHSYAQLMENDNFFGQAKEGLMFELQNISKSATSSLCLIVFILFYDRG